jgi:hypothetical protein
MPTAPTPGSITRAHPGGDAVDPEGAALELLDRGIFERNGDRFRTLSVHLPDSRHWTRVKLWGHPTRAAYRFGDEHYAVAVVWYRPAGGPDDAESCLTRFLDEQRPVVEAFGVHETARRMVRTLQEGPITSKQMVIALIDASVEQPAEDYVGAIASYGSWPGTCLIHGFVVVAGKHRELALRIRERWVAEGAPRLAWSPNLKQAPSFDAR